MRVLVLTIAACLPLAGCVHLGRPFEPAVLPPGAPSVAEILSSLAANEAALRTFKATGKFILESPDLEATQYLPQSSIRYRSPADLFVVGRKHATNVVELTCVDDALLVVLPTEKQYLFRPQGERFEGGSSADVVREMFRPEAWAELSPRQVRLAGFDAAAQTARLEIFSKGLRPRLRRTVKAGGGPWVLLESTLHDRDGQVLAVTTKAAYHEQDGIRFPKEIASAFPAAGAQMRFTMRRITLNDELEPADFAIEDKVTAVRRKGYDEIDIHGEAAP